MIRRLRLPVSILATAVLVACGGGGSSAPKSPATESALKTAVAAFGDAILQGDSGKAYGYFTKECRSDVSKGEFAFMVELATSMLEGFADTSISDMRTGEVELQNFKAESAEARSTVIDGNGDTFSSLDESGWSAWEYQDGGWRTSDCEEFGGGSGDLDMGASSDYDPFAYPECSLLVEGQPVPEEFGTGSEIDLSCDEGTDTYFGFTMTCFTSDREYASSDIGFAFIDEGIYYSGDVRGCAPPCSDLVDGQPVPESFNDDSASGFNLNCELPTGEENYSFEWDCFDSDRMYVQNNDGYAFVDDRIYVAGPFGYC